MSVEWHDIAGYRVSFDARLEASRFIIVQDERPAWWRRLLARAAGAPYGPRETVPVIVGRGLIEGDGPYVLWDEAPADTEVATTVATVMLAKWSEMRARLLEEEQKGRRPA